MSSSAVDSAAWKAENKGPVIITTCWIFSVLSTVFVAGRLWVRGAVWKKIQLDDHLVVAALICSYTATILSTVAVSYGNGQHTSLLSTYQQERTSFYTLLAFCPGILSFGLPKLAVIHLLTRLLNPTRKHKWFLWWLGIWSLLSLLVTCGFLVGRCYPAESQWNFSIEGTCLPKTVLVDFSFYSGSLSVFIDIYLAVYPMAVLCKLQMNNKKKLALSLTLGLGFISAIVAAYKVSRLPSLLSPDFSYDTADLVIWTIVEGAIIIIACSIPLLQPILDLCFHRNPLSTHSSPHRNQYGSRATSGTNINRSHYDKRTTRTTDEFDFGLQDEGNELENGLAYRTAVVSRQDNVVIPDDRKLIEHEHEEGMSGFGIRGILRTQVVTVSYADRKSVKSGYDSTSRSGPTFP
ncbi:hypothetical protein N0V93_001994 [Gnomoniopsis smithogilvyi]|uniref:Rhodopsin domain-containing protein n=1 Tax=Gnomoniopsis smithogilvyi TaxID=1191159 RepID=A0A9W9D267_9PEZI|nr:hypothetical protein N0V93_001994 [Gnomoniopsis smithogilvyi]